LDKKIVFRALEEVVYRACTPIYSIPFYPFLSVLIRWQPRQHAPHSLYNSRLEAANEYGAGMQVARITIQNFRGVSSGVVHFAGHTLLVGGNNIGKSTVCEALDLVLGPERMGRRPVVDEHDFHCGQYIVDGQPKPIRIEAVLIELSEQALLRFSKHLRRWDSKKGEFADLEGGVAAGDGAETTWCLPVIFLGQYDGADDDFIGNTFFDHPVEPKADNDEEEFVLGENRRFFSRDNKRLCGFVFLRALRTGSRALSLQRGSLLDTILKLGGTGFAEMWQDTLNRLKDLDPGIGEVKQLKTIRAELRERMGRFVNLAPGEDATGFFASELTREHLREVVRLFVATEPIGHLLPFARLGTGSINLLVFALLTVIAELKQKQSVIFAMEEPEIALPPHTQRRVGRFVLHEMGQVIVTSHSPYIIEQFEPDNIVILTRDAKGNLNGHPIDLSGVKPKTFRTERRQFAEAILAKAVLVVEGGTELALLPEASSVMEASVPGYMHFDMAGVSVFNAGGDGSVPRYASIFKALEKPCFGFMDKPNAPLTADATAKLALYDTHWVSPHKGIENVLIGETKVAIHRKFLEEVSGRDDYPAQCGPYVSGAVDAAVTAQALAVLKERKGDAYGYSAIFIRQCVTDKELPTTIRAILEAIDKALKPPPEKKDLLEDILE
jgi:putative ATP-dependent endonuclease of OLD family